MAERKIPKSITPCPIKSASIEFRFNSSLKDENIRQILFTTLRENITNIGNVAHRSSNESNAIEFTSRINLFCDSIVVGYAKNSLLFETVHDYPLWDDFYRFVSESLIKLSDSFKIERLTRVGLRYINFFDHSQKLEDIVNFRHTIGDTEQKFTNYLLKSEQVVSGKKVVITLTDNATFQKEELIEKGSVLDIDIVAVGDLPSRFDDSLLKIIQEAHKVENQIFFNMLTEAYYASLTKEF
jgi:uncharacterized protein (TIGR04255 family)